MIYVFVSKTMNLVIGRQYDAWPPRVWDVTQLRPNAETDSQGIRNEGTLNNEAELWLMFRLFHFNVKMETAKIPVCFHLYE